MHNLEHTPDGEDCDEVLSDMRERRARLRAEIKRLEQSRAPFPNQRALLRQHMELMAGEVAMLEYRARHRV